MIHVLERCSVDEFGNGFLMRGWLMIGFEEKIVRVMHPLEKSPVSFLVSTNQQRETPSVLTLRRSQTRDIASTQ